MENAESGSGTEAWVTLATNDTYAVGCLVLGRSLKRCATTRRIHVMVTPDVTQGMRDHLCAVFDTVSQVDVMDSGDSENLALIGRPDLGVTFTKLNCWRLTQYSKCVFLDADVLVDVMDSGDAENLALIGRPDLGVTFTKLNCWRLTQYSKCVFLDTNVLVDVMDSGDAENLALIGRPDLGVTFTKLNCWRLTQYSKCVFLDADVLVDVMDSGDAENLALIGRPDLGVTFTKLNCWRLTQYSKCVFLDADVLVDVMDSGDAENLALIGRPDLGVTFTKLNCWRLTQYSKCVFLDTNVLVDVMDSGDAENLALIGRPDLGVTFTKLNCWRLTQYSKCVFLDADFLVLANCDELFSEHDELSAVPDIGWPDCFNSGVFVFRPSVDTYHALLATALSVGSFDGGDQGLLNEHFSDWKDKDSRFRLSFIYNMSSGAVYTYAAAYKRFGSTVKVVHFLGAVKPWHHATSGDGRLTFRDDCHHQREHVQRWWNVFDEDLRDLLTPQYSHHAVAALLNTSILESEHTDGAVPPPLLAHCCLHGTCRAYDGSEASRPHAANVASPQFRDKVQIEATSSSSCVQGGHCTVKGGDDVGAKPASDVSTKNGNGANGKRPPTRLGLGAPSPPSRIAFEPKAVARKRLQPPPRFYPPPATDDEVSLLHSKRTEPSLALSSAAAPKLTGSDVKSTPPKPSASLVVVPDAIGRILAEGLGGQKKKTKSRPNTETHLSNGGVWNTCTVTNGLPSTDSTLKTTAQRSQELKDTVPVIADESATMLTVHDSPTIARRTPPPPPRSVLMQSLARDGGEDAKALSDHWNFGVRLPPSNGDGIVDGPARFNKAAAAACVTSQGLLGSNDTTAKHDLLHSVSGGAQGTGGPVHTRAPLTDAQHQKQWEEGRPDYMGQDSFENIKKALDESLSGPGRKVSD